MSRNGTVECWDLQLRGVDDWKAYSCEDNDRDANGHKIQTTSSTLATVLIVTDSVSYIYIYMIYIIIIIMIINIII